MIYVEIRTGGGVLIEDNAPFRVAPRQGETIRYPHREFVVSYIEHVMRLDPDLPPKYTVIVRDV